MDLVIKHIVKQLMKIITQPVFITLLFCMLIISGEQTGGFYLFYILLGLPHFVLHSVFACAGITCLLVSYNKKDKITTLLRVSGALLMIASLLYFFLQPNGGYNNNTFHEILPLSMLILFSILISVFIGKNAVGVVIK